tara:strand:- start:713 stop:976 length:264 start_codon:yes stop_codon:yes gene_type:complete
MIMENYKQLKTNEDLPVDFARQLGLDMNKFMRDFQSSAIANQLDFEKKQFNEAGFPRKAVPKFLLQGKEISWSTLLASVETELAKLK